MCNRWPYRYPAFLKSLAALVVPGLLVEILVCHSEAVRNSQKLLFAYAAFVMTVTLQHAQGTRQAHDFQVWSFSFDGCLVRLNILCT